MKEGAHSAVMGVKGSRAKCWPWDQGTCSLGWKDACLNSQEFFTVFSLPRRKSSLGGDSLRLLLVVSPIQFPKGCFGCGCVGD